MYKIVGKRVGDRKAGKRSIPGEHGQEKRSFKENQKYAVRVISEDIVRALWAGLKERYKGGEMPGKGKVSEPPKGRGVTMLWVGGVLTHPPLVHHGRGDFPPF